MKKIILSSLILIAFFSMNSYAQSNDLLAANLDNDVSYYDDVMNIESTEDASDANTVKYYNVPKSAVSFEMNLNTSAIDIDINNNVTYTKAELLSRDTNETLQSLEMNEGTQSVDVSKVTSGTYYIILSNDEGKVYSEKIIIL